MRFVTCSFPRRSGFAIAAYGPTAIASSRSGSVPVISEDRYRLSVRGYVTSLCCSYSRCSTFDVCFAEKP